MARVGRSGRVDTYRPDIDDERITEESKKTREQRDRLQAKNTSCISRRAEIKKRVERQRRTQSILHELLETPLKGLMFYLKVRTLRTRNLFLTPDEREEWLGDLREQVELMREQRRSKWAIRRYVTYQHFCFGWSKVDIVISRLFVKNKRG